MQKNHSLNINKNVTHKNLFFKVFIPFVLGFVVIQFILIISLEKIYQQYQTYRTNEHIDHAKVMYDNKLKETNKLYNEIIQYIQNDKQIAKLYVKKDREGLYKHTHQLYERLKTNFNITHFYFHGLDRKVFLRVHNYKKHSDLIDRYTLKDTQKTLQNSYGVEFGIAHNLTYRSVFPYYIDNKLVGYIELGEEIDYFTPYFSNILDAEILMAIKKEYIDLKNIRLTSKLEKLVKSYPQTKNYYVINSTISNINDKVKNLIDIKTMDKSDNYLDIQDTLYEVGSFDLLDIEKRNVGKMIILIDTKKEQITLKNFKFVLITITSIVSLLMIIIYFIYLKRTTKKLDDSTNDIIKLSITDQLTGLYNRRFFNEITPIELNRAIRNKFDISFIMIDIDNFKKYNDNYGHVNGDYALKEVANVLSKTLHRATDIVFRMGGEEFAILIIEDGKENSANIITKKILDAVYDLNIEHMYNCDYNRVTISLGSITAKASKDISIDTLYKQADELLYQAKQSGRNQVISKIDINV